MITRWRLFVSMAFVASVFVWGSTVAGRAAVLSPSDLHVSAARVSFYAKEDGTTPNTDLFRILTITNASNHAVNWAIPETERWIVMGSRLGSIEAGSTGTIAVGVDVTKAAPGGQSGTFTVWDADAIQPIQTVDVFLRVCRGVCVSVDVADTRHTVSPLLFGSQVDWLNTGSFVWDRPSSPTCSAPWLEGGSPRPAIVSQLRPLGLRMLRYPSGTPADFFHWYQAIGPMAGRVPQIDPWRSAYGAESRQCPIFGPDEFLQVAATLGTEVLTTSNAGTGSAQEAAGWLAYNLWRGIPTRYWEFGNETYVPGSPEGDPFGYPYAFSAAYTSPDRYAAAFDEYARSLRAVDPNVKVGASATAYAFAVNPTLPSWNTPTFAKITERVDFVSTHLLFPLLCTTFNPADQVYRFLLAAPTLMTFQLEQLKDVFTRIAAPANKTPDIAITEHGASFFCLDFDRNHTLGSALFSALSFHVFFRDPRIILANHSNLIDPLFQAPLTLGVFGGEVQSAFYQVFRLYAQAAGGRVTSTSVMGAPTFSTDGLGIFAPMSGLPVLDSVAVLAPDNKTLRVFVVNRSLSSDVTARVSFDALPGSTGPITVATVNGQSYESANSAFNPYAVILTARAIPAAAEFSMTFPAHSLVMLIAQVAQ